MKSWIYPILILIGGCCLGILSTFVKLAYGAGYTLSIVTLSQFTFGIVFLWVIFLFSPKVKLPITSILTMFAAGIPMALTGLFYYQALETLDASLAIIFLFQFVWVGSLLEWLLQKKLPSKVKLVSIAVLLAGSFLAAGIGTNGGSSFTWIGAFWGFLSSITFSLFVYLSSSAGTHLPAIQRSTLFATGSFILVLFIFPPMVVLHTPLSSDIVFYGLMLGLFGVALPPLLFSIGMPHVGSGLGTILTSAELPVAVIMSYFVLGEAVSIFQWLGVIIIFLGIMIGNRKTASGKIQANEKAAS
ncbi:EamA family transporter [Alkalihalophilus pseudofirmus]|uniref:EamA family transporter n=1 Tax=Alkalihalophilus pseudofirmus TaxID=79885 RepID=UPI000952F3F6|nr:EamA family transporter [Alkalihalophilus pseudofirmus]